MSDDFVIRGSGGETSTYPNSYGSDGVSVRSLGGGSAYPDGGAIETLNSGPSRRSNGPSVTQAETAPRPQERSAVGALADWVASLLQSLFDWLEA